MTITGVTTYLVDASPPGRGGWEKRNWIFAKVQTDAGIHGVGEGSGWPRVVETAIRDLAPLVIGEDPLAIERLWLKMFTAIMGHGRTGVVGAGAITAIEMALWDIKGKARGVPVWDLLGGRIRGRVPVYAHATSAAAARALVDKGYRAIKAGGIPNCLEIVDAVRREIGPDIDLMVDMHGPPWMTTRDAIAMGRALEKYALLFYEEPVPPEDIEAIRRVSRAVDLPIAAGERVAYVAGARELIERGGVDVIQPDTGRFGGLAQMRKLAAVAEAHGVLVAPHDGSLGPVAEAAAVHLLASIPNCLILEHLDIDVPQRAEVVAGAPAVADGSVAVPEAPGLGIELVEDAIARYPAAGNVSAPDPAHDYQYVAARRRRARWLSTDPTERPDYLPGSIY